MDVLTLSLLLAAAAQSAAPGPSPEPQPSPTPPAPARRLDLGTYGAPTAGPPQGGSLTDSPRFESTIDVEGKAPADFNATMAVWWQHFNFEEPAIYGQGKGIPNGGVNLLPLVSKAVDAIKDAKRNREAERARKAADAAAEAAARPSPAPSPSASPSPRP
jgi:hypothetical protein